MSVPNVAAGQPITEAWGDAVADSVNALESGQAGHVAAPDPHTGYQKESEKGAASGYAALDSAGKVPAAQLPAVSQTVNVIIDGGGAAIAPGVAADFQLDYAGSITKWTLLADQAGSITVNIWKDAYGAFPPVAADVIASPAIAGALKAQSGALALAFAAGDIFRLNVASAATIQRCTVALTISRT